MHTCTQHRHIHKIQIKEEILNYFIKFYSIYLCVYIHVHMKKSKDNFQELILSLYYIGTGDQTQVVRLGSKALTHGANFLAQLKPLLSVQFSKVKCVHIATPPSFRTPSILSNAGLFYVFNFPMSLKTRLCFMPVALVSSISGISSTQ